MSGRKSSIVALLLICELIGGVAMIANALKWVESYEDRSVDLRFQIRYHLKQKFQKFLVRCHLKQKFEKILVSHEVVLAGVDEESTDPKCSQYSARWGVGGWLTRENWIQAIAPLALEYRPKVFAYDLLLTPYRSSKEDSVVDAFLRQSKLPFSQAVHDPEFPRTGLLNLLDDASNSSFAEIVTDCDDWRESGQTQLQILAAYTLNSSTLNHADPWDKDKMRDREKLEALEKREIPIHCFQNIPADMPFADNATLPFDPLPLNPMPSGVMPMGFMNVPRDADGIVRRIPLIMAFRNPLKNNEPVFVASLALKACLLKLDINPNFFKPGTGLSVHFGKEIVLQSKDRTLRIPIDRYGNMILNFEGTLGDFSQFTYIDILRGADRLRYAQGKSSLDPSTRQQLTKVHELQDMMRDHIVLAGLTFTGASDIGPCAVDPNTPLVFIHMTAIDNILRQSFFRVMTTTQTAVYLSVLMLLMWLLNAFTDLRFSAIAEIWLLVAVVAGPIMLVFFNVAVPMVLPGLSVFGAFGAIYLYRYYTEQQEVIEIRKKFSAMVSPRVLKYMEEHPEELHGRRTEATMFFSDVAGFTNISEKIEPVKMADLLNDYLTPMADLILARDGYLNKFAGDGIMAVWGLFEKPGDHAAQACFSALEQQAVVDEIRSHFQTKYRIDLKVRMGINSGIVSAGKMGSRERHEYTVMGDAVNFAARLEPAAKDYGIRILIGQNTFERTQGEMVARPMDKIVVLGKTEPILIYELMATRAQASAAQIRLAEAFARAMELYWKREWTLSLASFEEILKEFPKDPPSFVFVQRIHEFLIHPPPESWRGEYIRATKH